MKIPAGSKIGIVSPSKPVTPEDISRGLTYLSSLGYEPVLGRHIFERFRYMAGTPQERAEDLMTFYRNPEIKAIFGTAGGDGSQMIAPFLDYKIIKENPKPLVGFSDTTAIQNAIIAQTGTPQISGFLLGYDFSDGAKPDPQIESSLKTLLAGKKLKASGGQTVIGGQAEGILLGGCLSLFRSLCGTPYFPSLKNAILLIEDVEEKTYKLDLMLEQLRQCPDFSKVRGIVFGDFDNCEIRKPEDGSTDEIISCFTRQMNIPVIRRFPYGHQKSRCVLPLGSPIRINADACTLEQL